MFVSILQYLLSSIADSSIEFIFFYCYTMSCFPLSFILLSYFDALFFHLCICQCVMCLLWHLCNFGSAWYMICSLLFSFVEIQNFHWFWILWTCKLVWIMVVVYSLWSLRTLFSAHIFRLLPASVAVNILNFNCVFSNHCAINFLVCIEDIFVREPSQNIQSVNRSS